MGMNEHHLSSKRVHNRVLRSRQLFPVNPAVPPFFIQNPDPAQIFK